jgi:hypothetical protein
MAMLQPAGDAGGQWYNCVEPHGETMRNIAEVYSAYYTRSVNIVRSALSGTGDLSTMVAPAAQFVTFQGDVERGSRETGMAAARSFFSSLDAVALRYDQASPGPLSIDSCGEIETDLMFLKEDPHEGFRMTFHYSHGVLQHVQGIPVTFVTEPLRGRSVDGR